MSIVKHFRKVALGTLGFLSVTAQSSHAVEQALLLDQDSTRRILMMESKQFQQQGSIVVIEQSLSEIIELAGRFNGYEVVFSGPVEGIIKDTRLPMNMRQLMPKLSELHDLAWHMRLSRLFIARRSQSKEIVVELGGLDFKEFRSAIKKTDIEKNAHQISFLYLDNSVRVTGPASYVDGIAEIAKELGRRLN